MSGAEALPLWVKALLLGLVEGITEFIPVSSTGHLIVAGEWLGYTGPRANVFTVFIQLGAILAIVWLYRAKLWEVTRAVGGNAAGRRLGVNLAIAFVPAALIGFLVEDWIDAYLFRTVTVAAALVVGGIAILMIERWRGTATPAVPELEDIPPGKALGVGIAQILALFPGVSRSGATIMGGYAIGLSRRAATEFSFLLAIPIMVAATLYKLFKDRALLEREDVLIFAVGFVTAFVSALVVVQAFLRFVSRRSFAVFAWYRIVFGLALLAGWWVSR